MELRSEGQMLADEVDLWYKDRFLDSILAKRTTLEEERLLDSTARSQCWKNIFMTAIASVALSTGPVLPAVSHLSFDFPGKEIARPTDCQILTHRLEIICPSHHSRLGQITELLPIPARLPYINP